MTTDAITPPAKLLSQAQAAAYLGLKPQTLAVWRCTRRYPLPFIKCGRLVKYRQSDLEAWLRSRTIGTAEMD